MKSTVHSPQSTVRRFLSPVACRLSTNGNAILFSLIIMASALVASLGMASLVVGEIQTVALVPPAERAYYKAESFVEQGLWQKKQDPSYQKNKSDTLPNNYLCTAADCFASAPTTQNQVLKEFIATTAVADSRVTLHRDTPLQLDVDTSTASGAGRLTLSDIAGKNGFQGLEATIVAFPKNPQGLRQPLYRSFNNYPLYDHFYTMSQSESDYWAAYPDPNYRWNKEGIAGYLYPTQVAGTQPLYHSWNGSAGDNFYTMSQTEWNNAVGLGYGKIGITGYLLPYTGSQPNYNGSCLSGSAPLYRSYYGGSATDHFYTMSQSEWDLAATYGWAKEGIAGCMWTDAEPPSQVLVDKKTIPANQPNPAAIPLNAVTAKNPLNEPYPPLDKDNTYRLRLKALGADADVTPTVKDNAGDTSLQLRSPDFTVRSVAADGNARRGIQVQVGASPQANAVFDYVIFSDIDLKKQGQNPGPALPPPPPPPAPFFRLWHPGITDHYYTMSQGEYDYYGANGWVKEGVVGNMYPAAGADNTAPLYQSYNGASGDHFYTMSQGEWDGAANYGWAKQGIAGYLSPYTGSCPAGTAPLYRSSNGNIGDHFYTMNGDEWNKMVSYGWAQEGITGCMFPVAHPGAPSVSPLWEFYSSQWTDHFYTNNPGPWSPGVNYFNGYYLNSLPGYVYNGQDPGTIPFYWADNFPLPPHQPYQPSTPCSSRNPNACAHFYTTNPSEYDSNYLYSHGGYSPDGIMGFLAGYNGSSCPQGMTQFYRSYNSSKWDHWHTIYYYGALYYGYAYEGVSGCIWYAPPPAPPLPPQRQPLYEFYRSGYDHFYSLDYFVGPYFSYTLNGLPAYIHNSQVPGTVPLYQFYKGSPTYDHFLSTNYSDGATYGYAYNGTVGYIVPYGAGCGAGSTPLYQFYKNGDHFSSTNYGDGARYGYAYNGTIGCVWTSP